MPEERFSLDLGADKPEGHFIDNKKTDSIVPDGIYNLEVRSARLLEGRESKQKYIKWKLFVLDTDEDFFHVNTTLQEGKRWMFKNFMRAFGTPIRDGEKINLDITTKKGKFGDIYFIDGMKGRKMKAHVIIFNGKNEIKRVWNIDVSQDEITAYISDPKNNMIPDDGKTPF